jgi:thymidine phosphorylase
LVLEAWEDGYVGELDTMELGWAVQRLGAGRERPGESVDLHAGIEFHARHGARAEKGQPFATLYATNETMRPNLESASSGRSHLTTKHRKRHRW